MLTCVKATFSVPDSPRHEIHSSALLARPRTYITRIGGKQMELAAGFTCNPNVNLSLPPPRPAHLRTSYPDFDHPIEGV